MEPPCTIAHNKNMKKIRIIADDKIPFLKGALEDKTEIIYLPGNDIDKNVVRNADALITRTRTICNENLLAGSSVKFIASATIGYDHIDTAWCESNGIEWTNAPGCNSSSVRQYLVSALLNLIPSLHPDPSLVTMGIVGVGNVGSKIASAAKALGMKVMLNDPPRERAENTNIFSSLADILREADIISFHVPLNKEGMDKTLGMAGKPFFSNLKKPVILINTSRGPVVNGSELKKAINRGIIKACVLDVWEHEPEIDLELLKKVNFGTPHIAGYSTDGKANGTAMSVKAISRFFNLGLDEWHPAGIPAPTDNMIECHCPGKSELDIIREIYLRTYNISDDDGRLRSHPGNFEFLRGNYPVRREPPAYQVKLFHCHHENLPGKLKKLGFKL